VLLATVPVLVASGCTVGSAAAPSRAAAEITDDALRARALAREQILVAAYDRAAVLHPSLATILAAVRDHHARHATVFAPRGPSAAPSSAGHGVRAPGPASTGIPGGDAATRGSLPTVPDTAAGRAATVKGLRDLERQAASDGRAACLAASASLAPILASIRAAETAHDDLLASARV
jgi:hypothetical protein